MANSSKGENVAPQKFFILMVKAVEDDGRGVPEPYCVFPSAEAAVEHLRAMDNPHAGATGIREGLNEKIIYLRRDVRETFERYAPYLIECELGKPFGESLWLA